MDKPKKINNKKLGLAKNSPNLFTNLKKYEKDNNLKCDILSVNTSTPPGKPFIISIRCECGKVVDVKSDKFFSRGKLQCNDCGRKRASEIKNNGFRQANILLFESLGYKVIKINTCIKGKRDNSEIEDSEGYRYCISPSNIKKATPLKFNSYNPFTIYNIRKYIELNNLPMKLISDEYIGDHEDLLFECECGEVYKTSGWSNTRRQYQYRCPKCSKSQSIGESMINDYLVYTGQIFESQISFNDCKYKNRLRFDFGILKPNGKWCLIEFDGEQHYNEKSRYYSKEGVLRDSIKTKYCKNKGFDLLRLRYDSLKEERYKVEIDSFLNRILNIKQE